MRYLGIDYGRKRVGLAMSDDDGKLAFPLVVLSNNSLLIKNIKNICHNEKIEAVVLGESTDSSGNPNEVMIEIEKFKKDIETGTKLPVFYQKEFMTSLYASVPKLKNIFNARKIKIEKEEKNDASAATLILQRHLDKINNK
jgi:putative holliday junction resolvase